MNQIDLTTIYLIFLFILPGFLAYSLYTSLYKHSKAESDWTLILKSLLHSGVIYVIIYFVYRIFLHKIPSLPDLSKLSELHNLSSTKLIYLTLTVLGVSVFWGLILRWVAACKPHLFILKKVFKIEQQLRPPNLYASILEPRYNPKAADGYWIVFPHDDTVKMGYVEIADVSGADRLVWVRGLLQLNEEHEPVKAFPENEGIILDLNKTEWFEVLYSN